MRTGYNLVCHHHQTWARGGKDLPPCKAQSSPMNRYAVSCNLQPLSTKLQQNPKTAATCKGQFRPLRFLSAMDCNGFAALQMIGVGWA